MRTWRGRTRSSPWRRALVVAAAVVSAGALAAGAALAWAVFDSDQAAILWSADTETGDLSQWDGDGRGGVFNTGSGEVAVVSDPAGSGDFALRFSITGADGTTGPQATRIFRWRTAAGDPLPVDAYYGARFFFPEEARPLLFWNVMQWKTKRAPDRVDPNFVVGVGNRPKGGMYLYLWDSITGAVRAESPIDLPTDRWVHVEARYVWSAVDSGRVTLWQDGMLIGDVDGVRTMWPSSDPNARQWSLDNYTDGITPADLTIYADDAAISRERTYTPAGAPAPGGERTPPVIAAPGSPSGD